jgi:hypothetical protein
MKNILIAMTSIFALALNGQENQVVRFGIQGGAHGNSAYLKSGMEIANARFQQNPYGGGALSFVARYDHNQHWMLTSGIGVCSGGFDFSIAGNYSLRTPDKHYSPVRAEFSTVEIPLMLHYKFTPNCKHTRWLMGAGLIPAFSGAQNIQSSWNEGTESNVNGNQLNVSMIQRGGGFMMMRFAISREKLFASGRIFQASLVFNRGLREIATADVQYMINGKSYTHEFGNCGNFIGFRLAYFFKPVE